MAFMPFTKEDQPTMAKFNEKFLEAILEGKTQALDAGVKIATGSYTGTGTYGASNPNSLTFDFEPKFLFIHKNNALDKGTMLIAVKGLTKAMPLGNNSSSQVIMDAYVNISFSGNSVEFYNQYEASWQLNESGKTYNYIAIG